MMLRLRQNVRHYILLDYDNYNYVFIIQVYRMNKLKTAIPVRESNLILRKNNVKQVLLASFILIATVQLWLNSGTISEIQNREVFEEWLLCAVECHISISCVMHDYSRMISSVRLTYSGSWKKFGCYAMVL